MMMPTRRVQLVSTKYVRKSVIHWTIAKLEETRTDSKIAAQAVDIESKISALLASNEFRLAQLFC